VKLDHLQINQLPVLIYRMVGYIHFGRQLNLLMFAYIVRQETQDCFATRSKVAYCTHLSHSHVMLKLVLRHRTSNTRIYNNIAHIWPLAYWLASRAILFILPTALAQARRRTPIYWEVFRDRPKASVTEYFGRSRSRSSGSASYAIRPKIRSRK